MSDQNTSTSMSLPAVLRALPLQAPEREVWSQLARELAPHRRARRRYVLPAAVAAAILIAFAATYMLRLPDSRFAAPATAANAGASTTTGNGTGDPVNATDITNDIQTRLTALQSRSHDLERWLQDTAGSAAPLPGQDLAAAGEIENLIGLVDVELAAPEQRDAVVLWGRRVNLLEDLTALRYSNYRLAEASAGNRIN